jgi:hypothetical protein
VMAAPAPVVTAASAPEPHVVHVIVEQRVHIEHTRPPPGSDVSFRVSTDPPTFAPMRIDLGSTRLGEGTTLSSAPPLTCAVVSGTLTVVVPAGPSRWLPTYAWCGPPSVPGSVLFRIDVSRVEVLRPE